MVLSMASVLPGYLSLSLSLPVSPFLLSSIPGRRCKKHFHARKKQVPASALTLISLSNCVP